ncbi:MAG: hypothetical protein MK096_15005 [Oleiphilaceae bacterium]|nr:hypothetical protein [Oleiphilaceae bacterium]
MASTQWTDNGSGHLIGDIYTYGVKDTLSVYLVGRECENTKKYFVIGPPYVENGDQLIALVLAAKMAGKHIKFFYSNSEDTSNCFVRGVRILE